MKIAILTILAGLSLALSGCASMGASQQGKNFAAFVGSLPGADLTDASHSFVCPLWTNSQSASGISTDPDTGTVMVTNGKANLSIPLWGTTDSWSISGLKLKASADQIAQAKAAAAAAAAKTTGQPASSPAASTTK